MSNDEKAKYEKLLPKGKAQKEFNSLYSRCRILTQHGSSRVADGEVMAVCAYITGRDYVGSTATRGTCATFGCMTSRGFERALDIVNRHLQKTPVNTTFSRVLSLPSLAQKYQFGPRELAATRAVDAMFSKNLGDEYKDERIILAVFVQVCEVFEWDMSDCIATMIERYSIDQKDMNTAIRRIAKVYGADIKGTIQSALNDSRNSRQHTTKVKETSSPSKVLSIGSSSLKRKASEETAEVQNSNKRARRQVSSTSNATTATGPSTNSSPPPTSPRASTLDRMDSTDARSQTSEAETSSIDVSLLAAELAASSVPNSSEPSEPSEDEDEDEVEDESIDLTRLSWNELAERRTQMVLKKQKRSTTGQIALRAVFADRSFWV